MTRCSGEDVRIYWNQRWPLGASYARIVSDVCRLLSAPAVAPWKPTLVVERNGIGEVVLEAFRGRQLPGPLCGVTTVPGAGCKRTGPLTWSVGKERLVASLVVLVEQQKLQASGGLGLTAELAGELRDFRQSMSKTGRVRYEAARGRHDDLIMSLALACWGCFNLSEAA